MMNILEEAIIYATVMHQGKVRKFSNTPYILHPLEVAQIISTMTDDQEIIAAGILHDIVEDTDGTLKEIKERFGERVARLVSSETENKFEGEDPSLTWKKRKESSLLLLKNSDDTGIKMLWLADKLSNIRSLSGIYTEQGDKMWESLHQRDPAMHCWYYKSVAETVELSLNKTGAFKEFIKHINSVWPGTFDSEKSKYKKYREVSIDGCRLMGHGAKGDVYRYDDELVIKVYNNNNTYKDVEREIASSREAFILGIPTAISFGIVSVGDRYGAMYELVESETISECISRNPGQVERYATMMAKLAHEIHKLSAGDKSGFGYASDRIKEYVKGGLAREDEALAEKFLSLVDAMPKSDNLLHGDFHTGNIFLQKGEPLLIDMDRISRGNPIVEIADLHYFYVTLGENDHTVVEKFMGFPYDVARKFFDTFVRRYLDTEDEKEISRVEEMAALICSIRMINKLHKNMKRSEEDERLTELYLKKTGTLLDKVSSLGI